MKRWGGFDPYRYSKTMSTNAVAGQVMLGFTGLDLPGDIRDLTHDFQNWKWSWGHAGATGLDMLAILPVIGALKYTRYAKKGTDLVDGVHDIAKNVDNYNDLVKNNKKLFTDLSDTRIPMDVDEFNKIKNSLERQGLAVLQDSDSIKYLDFRQAGACTLNEKTILFRSNPTRSEVFEELIHTSQFRKGKVDSTAFSRLNNEIEAAEKLIKYKKQYRIPDVETNDTIKRLEQMKKN